jgi:hypothetical protein
VIWRKNSYVWRIIKWVIVSHVETEDGDGFRVFKRTPKVISIKVNQSGTQ